jgi:hypothetical protein
MTNDLTVQHHSLKDLETMANVVARSGLFGVKDPTQAMALMLLCQADGLHPMSACRQYHVIQGRASMTSQTMMSRFLQQGGRQEIHELTEEAAELTLSHPQGGAARVRWTIQQAQKAGLAGKDNWKAHPRSMLLRRAQAEAVRAVAPFILEGIPLEDEAIEINDASVIAPLKPELKLDKLPEIAQPAVPYSEIALDKEWDREIKARATRKAKALGGTVTKEGVALIPADRSKDYQEYVDDLALAHFTDSLEEVAVAD